MGQGVSEVGRKVGKSTSLAQLGPHLLPPQGHWGCQLPPQHTAHPQEASTHSFYEFTFHPCPPRPLEPQRSQPWCCPGLSASLSPCTPPSTDPSLEEPVTAALVAVGSVFHNSGLVLHLAFFDPSKPGWWAGWGLCVLPFIQWVKEAW